MAKANLKKISAFLPQELLKEASLLSKQNQTDTLVSALKELIAKHHRIIALKSLKNIVIDYDVNEVRQRRKM